MIEVAGQLKEIEEQLDLRFYRCYRPYIVNRDNIVEVNFSKLVIYMKNGEDCPISIRIKKDKKICYLKFYKMDCSY